MRFQSILFEGTENSAGVAGRDEPPFFPDLNLDQVLKEVTVGREEYDLNPFFYAPLHDVEAVEYRHDVLRDLRKQEVCEAVERFTKAMRMMREHLVQAEKLHYAYQKKRWFLGAAEVYCGAVRSLTSELADLADDLARI